MKLVFFILFTHLIDAFVTFGCLQGRWIKPLPICFLDDQSTILFFWKYIEEPFPLVFLRNLQSDREELLTVHETQFVGYHIDPEIRKEIDRVQTRALSVLRVDVKQHLVEGSHTLMFTDLIESLTIPLICRREGLWHSVVSKKTILKCRIERGP